jgi:hypothetical protein
MPGLPSAVLCSRGGLSEVPVLQERWPRRADVGCDAAPDHHRNLLVVQPYKRAGRAQANGAHQGVAHFVALRLGVADDGAQRVGGAAASRDFRGLIMAA